MEKQNLNMENVALHVSNFSKKYHGRSDYAVFNASFSVLPGEFHGFIGANGAGKTTTIKSLIGAYASYEGKIDIFGNKNTSKKGKKRLGYIPENANFPKTLKALEYVMHMAKLSGMSHGEAKRFAKNTLTKIGLANLMNKNPNTFSSGQKKKVLLAQALVNNPDVIIMDEPAANLDPKARNEFFQTLKKLQKEGKAIFISSHILAELDSFVDAVTILDNGKVAYTGKRSELLKSHPFTYNIDFEKKEDWEKLEKLLKALKIEIKNSELVSGAKTCFLGSKENLDKVLVYILKNNLVFKTFSKDQKTLQQAYDHFVQFGSRDTINANQLRGSK